MLSVKFYDLICSGYIDFVILFRSCSLFCDPIERFLIDAAGKMFINNYLVINPSAAEFETIYGEVADIATHGRTLCIQDDDTFIWDPDDNIDLFPCAEELGFVPECDGDDDGS